MRSDSDSGYATAKKDDEWETRTELLAEEHFEAVATASGTVDAHGGVIESHETGVALFVPPGALPEAAGGVLISFEVGANPNAPAADGEKLVTPMVSCGPAGLEFRTPVYLRMPRTSGVDPLSWRLKSSGESLYFSRASTNERRARRRVGHDGAVARGNHGLRRQLRLRAAPLLLISIKVQQLIHRVRERRGHQRRLALVARAELARPHQARRQPRLVRAPHVVARVLLTHR